MAVFYLCRLPFPFQLRGPIPPPQRQGQEELCQPEHFGVPLRGSRTDRPEPVRGGGSSRGCPGGKIKKPKPPKPPKTPTKGGRRRPGVVGQQRRGQKGPVVPAAFPSSGARHRRSPGGDPGCGHGPRQHGSPSYRRARGGAAGAGGVPGELSAATGEAELPRSLPCLPPTRLGRSLLLALPSPSTVPGCPSTIRSLLGQSQDGPTTILTVPALSQAIPEQSQHRPRMSQHYPNCPRTIPDCPSAVLTVPALSQTVPGQSQPAPASSQHHPRMSQHYPNCPSTVPARPQHYPNCSGAVPDCPSAVPDFPSRAEDCPSTVPALSQLLRGCPSSPHAFPPPRPVSQPGGTRRAQPSVTVPGPREGLIVARDSPRPLPRGHRGGKEPGALPMGPTGRFAARLYRLFAELRCAGKRQQRFSPPPRGSPSTDKSAAGGGQACRKWPNTNFFCIFLPGKK